MLKPRCVICCADFDSWVLELPWLSVDGRSLLVVTFHNLMTLGKKEDLYIVVLVCGTMKCMVSCPH